MPNSDSLPSSDSLSIQLIDYCSITHIRAAARFSRLCHEVEAEYIESGSPAIAPGELRDKLEQFAIGSVIFSVAYLEATINELFKKNYLEEPHRNTSSSETKKLMATMWELGIPKTASYSILDKYQIGLALTSKKLFETDKHPYQPINLLVKLRNALIHYEPEAVVVCSNNSTEITVQKLEKQLRNLFSLNPLAIQTEPFFPTKCLAYGCAKWAVVSSLEFADKFFGKMGRPSNIEHVRSELQKTESHIRFAHAVGDR